MTLIHFLYLKWLYLYTFIYAHLKNIEVSHGTIIHPTSTLSVCHGGKITIGPKAHIGISRTGYNIGFYHPTRLYVKSNKGTISIGENTNLNGVNVCARSSVHIGARCRIASGVMITDYNGHITKSTDRTKGVDIPCPIHIGDNVWIGFNSIILKGTNIGNNSVISAGSVVKGFFPPNCIIAGNPAKVIKIFEI